MVRIYKHFDLRLRSAAFVGRKLSFSSYPGEASQCIPGILFTG